MVGSFAIQMSFCTLAELKTTFGNTGYKRLQPGLNKMKNTLLTLIPILLANLIFGQTNNHIKLIELGKAYKDFMFRNEPNKQFFKEINNGITEDLNTATSFIVQTITTKNKLLSKQYLSRPDDNTLKQLYIIRAIDLNLREENQLDNNNLIDSLTKSSIPTYELVDNYYGMLFTAIGNKNQPFDLSKVDFKLKDYNFKDDTEKAIFFLRCMKALAFRCCRQWLAAVQ